MSKKTRTKRPNPYGRRVDGMLTQVRLYHGTAPGIPVGPDLEVRFVRDEVVFKMRDGTLYARDETGRLVRVAR